MVIGTTAELEALYGWRAASADDRASTHDELRVPPRMRQQLEAFGRAMAPNECCGVGIGPPGEVAEFHPVPNTHETPVTRYQIAADDQLRIYKRALERDWDITLVFHTHPATEAYPSATDIGLASWPDAVYAILSLADDAPHLRAFRIVDGRVAELPTS